MRIKDSMAQVGSHLNFPYPSGQIKREVSALTRIRLNCPMAGNGAVTGKSPLNAGDSVEILLLL